MANWSLYLKVLKRCEYFKTIFKMIRSLKRVIET